MRTSHLTGEVVSYCFEVSFFLCERRTSHLTRDSVSYCFEVSFFWFFLVGLVLFGEVRIREVLSNCFEVSLMFQTSLVSLKFIPIEFYQEEREFSGESFGN